jgi:class 3 adenylate cyclase/tetratricopeptide (TPR) repeat protein
MKFCGSCGASLSHQCASCGADNPASFAFCGACGAAFTDAPEAPLPEGEYRRITVLFCDLADSTALADRLPPETYRDVMREYHATCAEAIRRFGGHVAQYLGDGLLVYFGYPEAHEEDVARAVHTGLEILRAMRAFNQRFERLASGSLAARIGIHTGPVVTGPVGTGARREQLALGQTPNLAARLQAVAAHDSVVISAATYAHVRGFFTCEPLGEIALRGVSRVVEAFRVVSATGVQSRFELAVAKGLTPSVNRRTELTELMDAFDRVGAGAWQIVDIVGEPGIGKSRLLEMFQDRAAKQTPFWIMCRCTPYAQHSALRPIIDFFERVFEFHPDDSPVERRRKVEAALAPYTSLDAEAAALFLALLSVPSEGAEVLNLAPERQRERTLEVLRSLLLSVARDRTAVVVIEDLHWADPSTLEFLQHVIDRGLAPRIMLVVTHRPVFTPRWKDRAPVLAIRLDRLTDDHVRTMVEHIAGGRTLPEEVVRYIIDKTDGVPLFVEELTHAVLDSGSLVAGDHGYTLTRPLATLGIPVTLQDLLLTRLDRLGPAKDVALLACVLGREFTYEVIQAVSRTDEARLRSDLSRLIEGGVLYQFGDPPDATYAFRHVLLQEAAHALLLPSARQQHHRHVAETILRRFPELSDSRPELLAHHFTEGGLAENAAGYWLRASRREVDRSANIEASQHARQGLAVLDQVAASTTRDTLELGLQSALGSATIAVRGYGVEPVEKAFARALELCQRLGNAPQRFRAELGLWTYYVVRADYARALELADELAAIAPAQNAPGALVQAAYCRGFSHHMLGHFHVARGAFAEAVAIDVRDDDPSLTLPTGDDVRIHLLAFFGLLLWHLGQPAEAMARCEEARTLARRLAHPYGIAFAANALAFLGLYADLTDMAGVAVAESRALALDKGYRYFVVLSEFMQGWMAAGSADGPNGHAAMERSLLALRGAGARMGETFMRLRLIDRLLQDGRATDARAHLADVQTTTETTQERFFEPELHRLLGEAHVNDRERHFTRAIEQARAHGDHALQLRAAIRLADLWADAGRRGDARALLTAALTPFGAASAYPDVDDARARLTRLG